MEYETLGSAPWGEDCVQVTGSEPYMDRMTQECRRFKTLLEKQFPIPAGVKARFTIKRFDHDFGPYKEVCIEYDPEDPTSAEFASTVCESIPENWDTKSKK